MTLFLFMGDMLVTAFMIGLAIWIFNLSDDGNISAAARIPLEDENYDG